MFSNRKYFIFLWAPAKNNTLKVIRTTTQHTSVSKIEKKVKIIIITKGGLLGH